jgi:8-oxo-dGDP phosphatase
MILWSRACHTFPSPRLKALGASADHGGDCPASGDVFTCGGTFTADPPSAALTSEMKCLAGSSQTGTTISAPPYRPTRSVGVPCTALGDTGRVNQIRRVASREVYRNDWLTLREDDIRLADGSSGIYSVIDKPTYALVIPRDGDRFHLVEQFRYPLGMRRWEFPQGTAPGLEDLDPIELAHRELREETGLRATSMELLGMLDVAPGMSSQRGRVFIATGLTEGEHDREHEEQDMHSEWFTREQLVRMVSLA